MLTSQLVQRLRLFYRSKTIFVGLLPLSDEPSEWLYLWIQNLFIGILNPYLYYALNNESCMAKFQAIIYHRSFVEIKMLRLRYVPGAIPGKSEKENHGKWQVGENEEVWGK
jgi:hypothetical protein